MNINAHSEFSSKERDSSLSQITLSDTSKFKVSNGIGF